MATLASIDLLRNVALFGGLGERELRAITDAGRLVSVRAATCVLRAGDRPEDLWVVLSGHVRLVDDRQSVGSTIDVLGRGAHFGETALDGTSAPFSVHTVTDVDLLGLTRGDLAALASEWPGIDAALRFHVERRQQVDEYERGTGIAEPLRPFAGGTAGAGGADPVPADGPIAWKKRPYVAPRRPPARPPVVRQVQPAEAGPACLASVCRHYGRSVGITRIRESADAARGPALLAGLARAADSLGFEIAPRLAGLADLQDGQLPAIARVDGGHWVVVYGVSGGRVTLVDPASGRERLSEQTFAARWSGETLFLRPTEAFADVPEVAPAFSRVVSGLRPFARLVAELLAASLLIQLLNLALPLFARFVIDDMIARRDERWLLPAVEAMGGVLVLLFAVSVSRRYLLQYVSRQFDARLATDFYRHLLALPVRFFETRAVGDVVNRFDDAAKITRFLTGAGVGLLIDVITAALYVVLMLTYSVSLTAVALAVVALEVGHLYVVTPFLTRGIRETFTEELGADGLLLESLSGLKTIKLLAVERFMRWRIESRIVRVVNSSLRTLRYSTAAAVVSQLLANTSALAVLFVGALLVLRQQLTIGQLVAFGIMARGITAPFGNLATAWRQLQDARHAVGELGEILDTPVEVRERPGADEVEVRRLQGHVRFEAVGFRYRDDSPPALVDVTFECYAGQRLAIVGPSGSGKSTVLKLLLGLHQPTDGRITVDGFDLRDVWLPSLRRQTGVVLQEPFLFRGPIRANIAQAAPSAGLADVVAAARLVNAHGFISRLPAGYETPLEDNGSNLSGGQRQQVALARALLEPRGLLMFDEATSNLDNESERMFHQSLDAQFRESTVITVTQRLAAVQDADLILVLDRGRIVERGGHGDLVAAGGLYSRMFAQQGQ